MRKILNIKYQISKIHIKNVKIFVFLVCVFGICFLVFDFGFAQPISSTELINNAKQYDGKTVCYQGEVVGDVMVRRQFVWLNLWDGQKAIGIWLKKDILPEIKFIGRYQEKGDLLEVEGVFHMNCLQHGGDLDIHAERIVMLREGKRIKEEISPAKIIWARNFSGLAVLLWICIIMRGLMHRWKTK